MKSKKLDVGKDISDNANMGCYLAPPESTSISPVVEIMATDHHVENMAGFKFIKKIAERFKGNKYLNRDLLMCVRTMCYSAHIFDGRVMTIQSAEKPAVFAYITADLTAEYPIHSPHTYIEPVVCNNVHEALVFVFGHEFAHYLQICSGRKLSKLCYEQSASRFAKKLLTMFRRLRYE